MHILITGGAGFIGSQIVRHHLNKGDKVQVVDNLSTGSFDNIATLLPNDQLRFIEADILTWSGLEKAVNWADRIYHMAAVVGVHRVLAEPINVLATNIAGCERLLRAVHASGWHPTVLIASTSEVYGSGLSDTFDEDSDLIIKSGARSRWNYAISKLADEALALSYARHFNLPIIVIRFFNTVGPRQTGRYGMVVPRFVQQAVDGSPITVYGDGSQTRCFCDVRDTVVALDLLAENPSARGQIINVGNNREISIQGLAELVKARAGSSSEIKVIPYLEAYGEGFEDIHHRKPNLNKFLQLTNFHHQWRLEDTLDDLITTYAARQQREFVVTANQ